MSRLRQMLGAIPGKCVLNTGRFGTRLLQQRGLFCRNRNSSKYVVSVSELYGQSNFALRVNSQMRRARKLN
jgi:hypothetical protein